MIKLKLKLSRSETKINIKEKFRVKQTKKTFLKFRSRKEAFVLILKCTTAKKKCGAH